MPGAHFPDPKVASLGVTLASIFLTEHQALIATPELH